MISSLNRFNVSNNNTYFYKLDSHQRTIVGIHNKTANALAIASMYLIDNTDTCLLKRQHCFYLESVFFESVRILVLRQKDIVENQSKTKSKCMYVDAKDFSSRAH